MAETEQAKVNDNSLNFFRLRNSLLQNYLNMMLMNGWLKLVALRFSRIVSCARIFNIFCLWCLLKLRQRKFKFMNIGHKAGDLPKFIKAFLEKN